MRIYSWNMLFRNQRQDDAYAFIRDADADVFCLQEVPVGFLERLKALPLSIVSAVDSDRGWRGKPERISVVILSRHPIHASASIPFPDYVHNQFVRVFLLRPLGWSMRLTNRNGLYADIRVPGMSAPVRVFNLHLILGTIARRAAEFDTAMRLRDSAQPTIVCGDFNILESPKVTLLNWILGGRLRDIFAWKSERAAMERRFASYGFTNPLRGRITHPFGRSQLDHILVSKEFPVRSANVLANGHGSDHLPVTAELG